MSKWKNKEGVYKGELIDNIISQRTQATIEFARALSNGKILQYANQPPIRMDVSEPIIIPFEDGGELAVPEAWSDETIQVYMGTKEIPVGATAPTPKEPTKPKESKPKKPKKGLKEILEYADRKV